MGKSSKLVLLHTLFPLCIGAAFFQKNYTIQNVSYSLNSFTVTGKLFAPKTKTDKMIVIFPPIFGETLLEKNYAKSFAKSGFNALLITGWSNQWNSNINDLDLEIHNTYHRQAEEATNLILSHNTNMRIALFGTSLGAMFAHQTHQRHPEKIKIAFLVVGGANIAEIIANSNLSSLKKLRTKRFEKYNFKNKKEYIEALKKQVASYETLTKPWDSKQHRVGMAIATKDKIVPTKNQLQLKEYIKPTYEIHIQSGHLMAIFKTWLFHRKDILKFFQDSFNASQD